MIRSFLALALLPLAISAVSSITTAGAGFDVDDVDFKETTVIASTINQFFQGNRRKMLNNAFRDLAVSDQCKTETDELVGKVETVMLSTEDPILLSNCGVPATVATGVERECDVKDMFDADFHDSCKKHGQAVAVKMTMKLFVETWIFDNMSMCIAKSCDGEEFIKYLQDDLDATNSDFSSVNLEFKTSLTDSDTSGTHSTRMHYGAAAAASALTMAGVAFLN